MSMTVHVDIVSAEGSIYSGLVKMVYAPAEMGEVGIAPRHAPLLTRLKAGDVRLELDGSDEIQHFFVSGGILEVQPNLVTVLADTAVRAADLDEAAAREAVRRAEESLKDQSADIEMAKAQAELAEAAAQLRTIEKLRKLKK